MFWVIRKTISGMLLSPEHIKKFKEIYRMKFGKEISDQEAYEKGIKLIRLLMIIDKPITMEDYKAAKTLIALMKSKP